MRCPLPAAAATLALCLWLLAPAGSAQTAPCNEVWHPLGDGPVTDTGGAFGALTGVPATIGPATTGGAAGPTTGGRNQRPTTGRKKRRISTAQDGWEIWWKLNQHRFVDLHENRSAPGTLTSSNGLLTGPGRREAEERFVPNRPTADDLRDRVMPLLAEGLASDEAAVVRESALALGRIAVALDKDATFATLLGQLKSRHADARRGVILSLGLLGDRKAMPVLWNIMYDTLSAREMLGMKGSVLAGERMAAVLALGLVSEPTMLSRLRRFVERQLGEDQQLAAAGVLALGLTDESDLQTVIFLNKMISDERVDWTVRSQAPVALARLGDIAIPAVPNLVKRMADEDTPLGVRQSCAIALGGLASCCDEEVLLALMRVIRKDTDACMRHFSLMTLAQIGERSLAPTTPESGIPPGVARIANFLNGQLIDPDRPIDLPWAGLAVGVLGHAFPTNSPLRAGLAKDVHDVLRRHGNPMDHGALALAIGLLGAKEFGDDLLKRYHEANGVREKGYFAVALGLMTYRSANEDLMHDLINGKCPQLRLNLGIGLGLMGDQAATTRLLARVEGERSVVERVAIAFALAKLGDRRAIDTLVIMTSPENAHFERRCGYNALGVLAEGTPLPWYAQVSTNANYMLPLSIQQEILTSF